MRQLQELVRLWIVAASLGSSALAQVPLGQLRSDPYQPAEKLAWRNVAGTNPPRDTSTDSNGTIADADPEVLASAGRVSIWITGESCKVTVENSAGLEQWSVDNLADTTCSQLEQLRAMSDSALLGYAADATDAVDRSASWGLSERISAKDFGATGDGKTDDIIALNGAVADQREVFIPCGTYLISSTWDLRDRSYLKIVGAGDCAIIKPSGAWPASTNLIDVRGARNLDISGIVIDGDNITQSTLQMTAITGDGTASNPTYGPISVHNIGIVNWEQQGIGLGANAGYTAQDISIRDNNIRMRGGAQASNAIDNGASGTKLRYIISRNLITWDSQPARLEAGEAIFAGHGTNRDTLIRDNIIVSAPTNCITVIANPFPGEATGTSQTNAIISGNICDSPGWIGIAAYGVTGGAVIGNVVTNPQSAHNGPINAGILVTSGLNGDGSRYASTDVLIEGNVVRDVKDPPTMRIGISFWTLPGYATTGTLGTNQIAGAITAEIGDRDVAMVTTVTLDPLGDGRSVVFRSYGNQDDWNAIDANLVIEATSGNWRGPGHNAVLQE